MGPLVPFVLAPLGINVFFSFFFLLLKVLFFYVILYSNETQ